MTWIADKSVTTSEWRTSTGRGMRKKAKRATPKITDQLTQGGFPTHPADAKKQIGKRFPKGELFSDAEWNAFKELSSTPEGQTWLNASGMLTHDQIEQYLSDDNSEKFRGFHLLHKPSKVVLASYVSRQMKDGDDGKRFDGTPPAAVALSMEARHTTDPARRDELKKQIDQLIANEWAKTLEHTEPNDDAITAMDKGAVLAPRTLKDSLTRADIESLPTDEALERHRQSIEVLKNIFHLLQAGAEIYDAGSKSHVPLQGVPVAKLLSHGGRVNIQIPAGTAPYALTEHLGITDSNGKPRAGVFKRDFGTHHVSFRKGKLKEQGGQYAAIRSKLDDTELYGINLAIGGLGLKDFNGDTILNDGAHGHVFIGYRPPKADRPGGLQIGIETTGPGAPSTVGYVHNWRSTEKTANPISSVGGLKQDKIGDEKGKNARTVDLRKFGDDWKGPLEDRAAQFAHDVRENPTEAIKNLVGPRDIAPGDTHDTAALATDAADDSPDDASDNGSDDSSDNGSDRSEPGSPGGDRRAPPGDAPSDPKRGAQDPGQGGSKQRQRGDEQAPKGNEPSDMLGDAPQQMTAKTQEASSPRPDAATAQSAPGKAPARPGQPRPETTAQRSATPATAITTGMQGPVRPPAPTKAGWLGKKLGTGGHGLAGMVSNKGAADREQALADQYELQIGPDEDDGGEHFSHKMLDHIEKALGDLPPEHVTGSPTLRKIIRDISSEQAASAYDELTDTVNIVNPPKVPSFVYSRLNRRWNWQRKRMDRGAIRDHDGVDREQDRALGITEDRHVMGGVSDVLANGNLIKWTMRHEIAHSVDKLIDWKGNLAGDDRFGGWRVHSSTRDMEDVARAIFDKVGITDDEANSETGGSSLVKLFASLLHAPSRREDITPLEEFPADAASENPDLKKKLDKAVDTVKFAMAQPWMLDDGGASKLEVDGRIYHVDQYDNWVSYRQDARNNAVSNYQFSTPAEWFAETYASYYDPDPAPKARLTPEVRDFFANDLPDLINQGRDTWERINENIRNAEQDAGPRPPQPPAESSAGPSAASPSAVTAGLSANIATGTPSSGSRAASPPRDAKGAPQDSAVRQTDGARESLGDTRAALQALLDASKTWSHPANPADKRDAKKLLGDIMRSQRVDGSLVDRLAELIDDPDSLSQHEFAICALQSVLRTLLTSDLAGFARVVAAEFTGKLFDRDGKQIADFSLDNQGEHRATASTQATDDPIQSVIRGELPLKDAPIGNKLLQNGVKKAGTRRAGVVSRDGKGRAGSDKQVLDYLLGRGLGKMLSTLAPEQYKADARYTASVIPGYLDKTATRDKGATGPSKKLGDLQISADSLVTIFTDILGGDAQTMVAGDDYDVGRINDALARPEQAPFAVATFLDGKGLVERAEQFAKDPTTAKPFDKAATRDTSSAHQVVINGKITEDGEHYVVPLHTWQQSFSIKVKKDLLPSLFPVFTYGAYLPSQAPGTSDPARSQTPKPNAWTQLTTGGGDPLGTGGHGLAGMVSNKGAAEREQALADLYDLQIGPDADAGGKHFSHKMLDRIEKALGELPPEHITSSPTLRKIIRSLSSEQAASEYDEDTDTINIVNPPKVPTFIYSRLNRRSDWQRKRMDRGAMADYPGVSKEQDAALGITGRRQVMGGVSDVLANGNLLKWTIRHEVAHSIDKLVDWRSLAHEDRFGGWQEHSDSRELQAVARAIFDKAGISDDKAQQKTDDQGQSDPDGFPLIERFASLLDPGFRRKDMAPLESFPADFASTDPDLKDRLEKAVRTVKIAMAQPWTLADGGAQELEVDGRIYHVDPYNNWVSYRADARDNAVSNYQFSTPKEWFAETYASYHDPNPAPREHLTQEVRDFFQNELPGLITQGRAEWQRIRENIARSAGNRPSAPGPSAITTGFNPAASAGPKELGDGQTSDPADMLGGHNPASNGGDRAADPQSQLDEIQEEPEPPSERAPDPETATPVEEVTWIVDKAVKNTIWRTDTGPLSRDRAKHGLAAIQGPLSASGFPPDPTTAKEQLGGRFPRGPLLSDDEWSAFEQLSSTPQGQSWLNSSGMLTHEQVEKYLSDDRSINPEQFRGFHKLHNASQVILASYVSRQMNGGEAGKRFEGTPPAALALSMEARHTTDPARRDELNRLIDQGIIEEWSKTLEYTELNDDATTAINKGAVLAPKTLLNTLTFTKGKKLSKDEVIKRHGQSLTVLKNIFHLLQEGAEIYDGAAKSHVPLEDVPVAKLLSHGGRVNVQIPAGTAPYALTEHLGITDSKGNPMPGVFKRLIGTHHVSFADGKFKEQGGQLAALKTKFDDTELYGINLAVGGLGLKDFNGDVILPDGAHGHMFLGYRPPKPGRPGALQIGMETTGPGAPSTVGYVHNWRSTEKTANPISSVGGLKQDKIGDESTKNARTVDLGKLGSNWAKTLKDRADRFEQALKQKGKDALNELLGPRTQPPQELQDAQQRAGGSERDPRDDGRRDPPGDPGAGPAQEPGTTAPPAEKKSGFFATAPQTDPADDDASTTDLEAEAMEVLKEQDTLRIFIPRAPGNGHQGASVQLMKRLVHLGFSGEFDVVYDDSNESDGDPTQEKVGKDGKKFGLNRPKLESLLPGFKANGDPIQRLETGGLKVNVMGLKTFQAQSDPKPAKYGLTGAMDNHEKPDGILTKLGVSSFVQLQPMGWNRESGRRGVTYRDNEDKEQFHEVEALAGLGYIYDTTEPDDPKAMIVNELEKSGAAAKTPGVLAFLDETPKNKDESPRTHTMVVYGLGTGMEPEAAIFELFNLITGVLYAQDDESAGTDLKDKGAIIGAAGWTDKDEIATLDKMLSGAWEGGLRLIVDKDDSVGKSDWEALVDRLNQRLLKDGKPRATVINIEDEDAPDRMANVGPHEVLVVEFSPSRLPMPVFEYLRSKTSLPNGFESVNGMDKERQNKPYFHVGKDISNKFPGADELDGMAGADQAAEQAKLVGQQLQGRAGLGNWKLSYNHDDRLAIFQAISELESGRTLESPRKDGRKVALKVGSGIVTGEGEPKLKDTRRDKPYTRTELNRLYEKNKEHISNKLQERDPDRLIGQYLNDTQKPDSNLSKYFDSLKARSATRDQVKIAFTELLRVEKNPPPPTTDDGAMWTAPEAGASAGAQSPAPGEDDTVAKPGDTAAAQSAPTDAAAPAPSLAELTDRGMKRGLRGSALDDYTSRALATGDPDPNSYLKSLVDDIDGMPSGFKERAKELLDHPERIEQQDFAFCGLTAIAEAALHNNPMKAIDVFRSLFDATPFPLESGGAIDVTPTAEEVARGKDPKRNVLLGGRVKQIESMSRRTRKDYGDKRLDIMLARALPKLWKSRSKDKYDAWREDVERKFDKDFAQGRDQLQGGGARLKRGDFPMSEEAYTGILQDVFEAPAVNVMSAPEGGHDIDAINALLNDDASAPFVHGIVRAGPVRAAANGGAWNPSTGDGGLHQVRIAGPIETTRTHDGAEGYVVPLSTYGKVIRFPVPKDKMGEYFPYILTGSWHEPPPPAEESPSDAALSSAGTTAEKSGFMVAMPQTDAAGSGDATTTDSEALAEAMEVLKEQDTLRIFIPRAPGNGHQGASVQLMKRLVHLGFSGEFDVVYDDSNESDDDPTQEKVGKDDKKYGLNRPKLESLLPGFKANGAPIQRLETGGLKVNVMGLKTFQAQSDPKPAKYGLTGAVDNHEKPKDILNELKVSSFVQLQPMDWNSESGRRGVTYRDSEGKEQFHEVEALAGLGYIYDATPPADPKAMIEEELTKTGTDAKARGVLAFLEQTRKGPDDDPRTHTMVVYGLGTGEAQNSKAPTFELFNLITGVLYAQSPDPDDDSAGTDLQHKGVVLGAAGWVNDKGELDQDELDTLNKMLSAQWEGGLQLVVDREGNARKEDWEALAEHLKKRLFDGDKQRAAVINIEDQDAPQRIADVKPGEVLVVEFSPKRLPMPVFELLRSRTSLPNGFESVNGMDKERQNKPYFHVGKEMSNNWPGKDVLTDTPKAQAMADRARLVGQQLQGHSGLKNWGLNYNDLSYVDIFTEIASRKPAIKLKSPRTGRDVTLKVRGQDVIGEGERTPYLRSELGKLYRVNKALIDATLRKKDPDRLIGRFLNDTQKPDSALRKYFDALKERSAARDQVAIAFTELLKVEKNPPPTTADDRMWTAPATSDSTGNGEVSGAENGSREAPTPLVLESTPDETDATAAMPPIEPISSRIDKKVFSPGREVLDILIGAPASGRPVESVTLEVYDSSDTLVFKSPEPIAAQGGNVPEKLFWDGEQNQGLAQPTSAGPPPPPPPPPPPGGNPQLAPATAPEAPPPAPAPTPQASRTYVRRDGAPFTLKVTAALASTAPAQPGATTEQPATQAAPPAVEVATVGVYYPPSLGYEVEFTTTLLYRPPQAANLSDPPQGSSSRLAHTAEKAGDYPLLSLTRDQNVAEVVTGPVPATDSATHKGVLRAIRHIIDAFKEAQGDPDTYGAMTRGYSDGSGQTQDIKAIPLDQVLTIYNRRLADDAMIADDVRARLQLMPAGTQGNQYFAKVGERTPSIASVQVNYGMLTQTLGGGDGVEQFKNLFEPSGRKFFEPIVDSMERALSGLDGFPEKAAADPEVRAAFVVATWVAAIKSNFPNAQTSDIKNKYGQMPKAAVVDLLDAARDKETVAQVRGWLGDEDNLKEAAKALAQAGLDGKHADKVLDVLKRSFVDGERVGPHEGSMYALFGLGEQPALVMEARTNGAPLVQGVDENLRGEPSQRHIAQLESVFLHDPARAKDVGQTTGVARPPPPPPFPGAISDQATALPEGDALAQAPPPPPPPPPPMSDVSRARQTTQPQGSPLEDLIRAIHEQSSTWPRPADSEHRKEAAELLSRLLHAQGVNSAVVERLATLIEDPASLSQSAFTNCALHSVLYATLKNDLSTASHLVVALFTGKLLGRLAGAPGAGTFGQQGSGTAALSDGLELIVSQMKREALPGPGPAPTRPLVNGLKTARAKRDHLKGQGTATQELDGHLLDHLLARGLVELLGETAVAALEKQTDDAGQPGVAAAEGDMLISARSAATLMNAALGAAAKVMTSDSPGGYELARINDALGQTDQGGFALATVMNGKALWEEAAKREAGASAPQDPETIPRLGEVDPSSPHLVAIDGPITVHRDSFIVPIQSWGRAFPVRVAKQDMPKLFAAFAYGTYPPARTPQTSDSAEVNTQAPGGADDVLTGMAPRVQDFDSPADWRRFNEGVRPWLGDIHRIRQPHDLRGAIDALSPEAARLLLRLHDEHPQRARVELRRLGRFSMNDTRRLSALLERLSESEPSDTELLEVELLSELEAIEQARSEGEASDTDSLDLDQLGAFHDQLDAWESAQNEFNAWAHEQLDGDLSELEDAGPERSESGDSDAGMPEPARLARTNVQGMNRLHRAERVNYSFNVPSEDLDELTDVARNAGVPEALADARTGFLDPRYFEKQSSFTWRLKPGVSASKALKEFFSPAEHLTVAECGTTMQAINYRTILRAVGETDFDRRFGGEDRDVPDEDRLMLQRDFSAQNPLQRFFAPEAATLDDEERAEMAGGGDDLRNAPSSRPAKHGGWYYIKNHELYVKRHPEGFWSGENAMYMGRDHASGEQMFSGFGVSPRTERDLAESLASEFNEAPSETEIERILRAGRDLSLALPTLGDLGSIDVMPLSGASMDHIARLHGHPDINAAPRNAGENGSADVARRLLREALARQPLQQPLQPADLVATLDLSELDRRALEEGDPTPGERSLGAWGVRPVPDAQGATPSQGAQDGSPGTPRAVLRWTRPPSGRHPAAQHTTPYTLVFDGYCKRFNFTFTPALMNLFLELNRDRLRPVSASEPSVRKTTKIRVEEGAEFVFPLPSEVNKLAKVAGGFQSIGGKVLSAEQIRGEFGRQELFSSAPSPSRASAARSATGGASPADALVGYRPPPEAANDTSDGAQATTAASPVNGDISPADGANRESPAPQTSGAPAAVDGAVPLPPQIDALVRTLVAKSDAWSSPRTQADKREAIALVTELLQQLGMDAKVVDRGEQGKDGPDDEHSACTCVR
ncbi:MULTISPECIES: hypothetical protein [Sorangium]|uniref:hypothetical protein n=1 Tax=Sorangium TaxID=39643 RepID=UPI003D9C46AA